MDLALALSTLKGGIKLLERRDEKVKLAGYLINFTKIWAHMYNKRSGIKGDFVPSKFDIEKKTVSIYDKNELLPISGKDVPVDELICALDGTNVYCIVEDGKIAERLFGDELEQVATVFERVPGRNEEMMTYLHWAADDDYSVFFASDKICI